MAEKKEIKVGDVVGFKYDVEQYGPVTKIKWDGFEYVYTVVAKRGEYVMDKRRGSEIELSREDIWTS